MSFSTDFYSHIPVIPIISLCILIFSRKRILVDLSWGGFSLVALGFAVFLSANRIPSLNQNDYLSMMMLGAILWLMGSFVLSYGSRAFKEALFPLFFLAFETFAQPT